MGEAGKGTEQSDLEGCWGGVGHGRRVVFIWEGEFPLTWIEEWTRLIWQQRKALKMCTWAGRATDKTELDLRKSNHLPCTQHLWLGYNSLQGKRVKFISAGFQQGQDTSTHSWGSTRLHRSNNKISVCWDWRKPAQGRSAVSCLQLPWLAVVPTHTVSLDQYSTMQCALGWKGDCYTRLHLITHAYTLLHMCADVYVHGCMYNGSLSTVFSFLSGWNSSYPSTTNDQFLRFVSLGK